MKIKNSRKNKKSKIALTLIGVVLVLGIAYMTFAYSVSYWPFDKKDLNHSKEVPTETDEVNYEPPTSQEVEDSQNAKERILDDSDEVDSTPGAEPESPGTTKKQPATINISFADIVNDNLEVRAFTTSVIEGTGECTATVSKPGSQSITKSTPAFVDVSSTICEPIYIPKSQLSSGIWSVNVTYSSPLYKGSSGTFKVEV